jgi:serine/threonine protein kinase
MAPEMISNKPYGFTLDIWCLGILLYELLHGYAPFKGRSEFEKCNNIIKMAPIDYDSTLSSEARLLIQGILKLNP